MSRVFKGGRQASLLFPRRAAACLLGLCAVIFLACNAAAAPPLAGYNPARLAYTPNGPFVDLSAFAADTVLPVAGIIDDSWRGDFTPGNRNRADVFWNAASGVVANGWRVAAFNRGEMFLDCNRSAIEFFYLTKKHRDLETNRTYTADVKVNGFIASGIEVSHGRRLDSLLPGLSVGATLRYLHPSALQDGTLTGSALSTGPKSYNFDLALDYSYSHNVIYKVKDEEVGSGFGFSADVGLAYRNAGWHAEALLRDIGGTIFWDSVPYTTANAVTPGAPTTTNGYQNFDPSIRGYEGHKRYRQEIPLKTDLTLGYDMGSLGASATMILINSQPRTWVEAAYRFSDSFQASLGYNIDYSAFTYAIATHGMALGITLSDFDVRDARALGAQLSYLYAW
jgi:hypothetical protein